MPIAYELTLELDPAEGLTVGEGYGFPTSDEGAKLTTSTVFLSQRQGAMLVRLEPTGDLESLGVSGSLSYKTPTGKAVTDTLEASFPAEVDERGHAYAQPSVAKTVALALLVSNMEEAAARYGEAPQAATELMQAVVQRFETDTEPLNDEGLTRELTFAHDLLRLMEEGAEQGTLYGDL